MKPHKVLSPTAILGYGFPEPSFQKALALEPDVIAVDAGSTDPGPYYLGAGKSFTDRGAVKRDLRLLLKAAIGLKIPLLIGSAGGSGAKPHLDWCLSIIEEVAAEENLCFKLAYIPADIDKKMVLKKLGEGKVTPLRPAPPLRPDTLMESTYLVAQMGVEPMIQALEGGAEVVLAGRAYDPVAFAAKAIMEGYPVGLALHMGKILECASIAATPGSGSDCMMGYLYEDRFELEPISDHRACTPVSVAAHTLYEKSNPYLLPGPGGILNLYEASFEAVTHRRVAVKGSKFDASSIYTVKLEGARPVGYRTVAIAGIRDPIMIGVIDDVLQGVKDRVADNFRDQISTYHLDFILYGKDGVMGDLEPVSETGSHELGLVIEAVAPSQEDADTICSFARSTMLHFGYEGRIATAGNLAFPYSPSDFSQGCVYEFSAYHVMEVAQDETIFKLSMRQIGGNL